MPWLGAALLSPHFWAPLAALATAGWLAWRERQRIPWRLVAAGLAFQATLVAAFSAFQARNLGPAPWLPDESLYREQAAWVAKQWGGGDFPALSAADGLGSLHTGYQRAMASLRLVGLRERLAGLSLNFAALAVAFVAFAALGSLVFDDAKLRDQAVAWFCFFPSHAAWGAFELRDLLHLAAFVVAVLAMLETACRRSPWAAAGSLAALFWLFTLRVYSAGLLVGAAAGWGLLNLRGRRAAWALPGSAAALTLCAPWLGGLLGPAANAFAAMLPGDWTSPLAVAAGLARGAFRLLFGPYGWVETAEFSPYYVLYPGQWVLYLGLMPGALAALWAAANELRAALRRGEPGPNLPSVAALTLAYFGLGLLLVLAYGGHAPRPWHVSIVGYSLLAPAGWRAIRRNPRQLAAWIGLFLGAIALRAVAR